MLTPAKPEQLEGLTFVEQCELEELEQKIVDLERELHACLAERRRYLTRARIRRYRGRSDDGH
jgi:hypothetical protein